MGKVMLNCKTMKLWVPFFLFAQSHVKRVGSWLPQELNKPQNMVDSSALKREPEDNLANKEQKIVIHWARENSQENMIHTLW